MTARETDGVPGKVLEVLPGETYRVALEDGQQVIAHVGGKMKRHFIRLLPGDPVTIEVSPFDRSKGRIVYRASDGAGGGA